MSHVNMISTDKMKMYNTNALFEKYVHFDKTGLITLYKCTISSNKSSKNLQKYLQ